METLNKYIRYLFFGKSDVSYPPARKKSDLNEVLPDNWSFMEDPLKKNLADYLIDNNITKSKENQNFWLMNSSPPLTSFLDEYRMENANRSVYSDELKFCSVHWHTAKSELTQNNSVGSQTGDCEVLKSSEPININMNPRIHDCYEAASQCSSKLEELKLKLSNKSRSKKDNKTYVRRPRKQFIEASSVREGYEDAYESDDVDRIANADYVQYNNFGSVIDEALCQIDAAITKVETDSKKSKEKSSTKMKKNEISDSDALDTSSTMSRDNEDVPKEKRKRNRKRKCKFFRVPSQNSDSEAASSFEQSPVTFTSHIGLSSSCDQTPSSLELPISFRQNLSSESLDNRKLSTTESEDSFIQFCDNGDDSCNESSVFDSDDVDCAYDSDSDFESGDIVSGLSKSVSNLTDDILYTENVQTPIPEIDQIDSTTSEQVLEESSKEKSIGILVNNVKKTANKDRPRKNVRFSSAPPRVKVMRVWAYAARCARVGHWERYVADRDRFKKRTGEVEAAISWVFDPGHREKMSNKIAFWKAAYEETIEKNTTSNLHELNSIQWELDNDSIRNETLVTHLEMRRSDEQSKYKECVQSFEENRLDDDLKAASTNGNSVISLRKDAKNESTLEEESITEDMKGKNESDTIDNPGKAPEEEEKLPNAEGSQITTDKEEIECVRNSKSAVLNNIYKTNNDNQETLSSMSQITHKEYTHVPELNAAEASLKAEEEDGGGQMVISNCIKKGTNIIEDFIIPTHKLNIQFGSEMNFVIDDSRIRLEDFIKKNGASGVKNCSPMTT